MIKKLFIISLFIYGCFFAFTETSAKKISYKLAAKESYEEKDEEMVAGSFMVASQCESCNNGYTISQVKFYGFDKNQTSSKESFFITNETNRVLTAVSLYVEYLTTDGRQLNKKFMKLSCNIPAGETRKVDIDSWDTQHSFYYYKSNPAKKAGNAFDVKFDIIAYYLRF